ncbi:MAG: threonine synthase [Candidatus Methanomethylicaceae archaeon]
MAETKKISLVCRECGAEYPATKRHICDECFAPLDVKYELKTQISKDIFCNREKTLWRYFELLPILDKSKIVDLGAGYTPLIKSERLAEQLGLKRLYIKNDTINPTNSFKDRPSSVAVSKALELGLDRIGCVSTGNLAAALAAHARKAGLTCYIFVPKDLEQNKIAQISVYDPEIIVIDGTYDDANRIATQVADNYGLAFANVDIRPYYVEGSKTLVLEVCEQLGWSPPDHVIVPAASGALYCATAKGLEELERLGLIPSAEVNVSIAQPCGCSPIVDAFKSNRGDILPVDNPLTVAKSLAVGMPADGVYVLRKLRDLNGMAEDVTDQEIINAIKLLAKTEGVFAEPAGGVTVAALKKFIDSGKIAPDETVVCYITGSGLKTPELVTPDIKNLKPMAPTFESLKSVIGGF